MPARLCESEGCGRAHTAVPNVVVGSYGAIEAPWIGHAAHVYLVALNALTNGMRRWTMEEVQGFR